MAFIGMATLLVFSDALFVLVIAFILYGLEYGMAEGTQRALVADFAPPDIKATVLGAYHTSVGVVKLASGLVAGFLWVAVAPTATFAFGAVTATFAAGAPSLRSPKARTQASGPGVVQPRRPLRRADRARPCGRRSWWSPETVVRHLSRLCGRPPRWRG